MNNLTWPNEPPRSGPVILRAFRRTDADCVRELAEDPYACLLAGLPEEPSDDDIRTWLRRQSPRLIDLTGFSFCIADAETDAPLGRAVLWWEGTDRSVAVIGYYVVGSARGRGVATAAVEALIGFAPQIEGLTMLEAYAEVWNTASHRVLAKAGFARDAASCPHVVIGDLVRDQYRHERPVTR